MSFSPVANGDMEHQGFRDIQVRNQQKNLLRIRHFLRTHVLDPDVRSPALTLGPGGAVGLQHNWRHQEEGEQQAPQEQRTQRQEGIGPHATMASQTCLGLALGPARQLRHLPHHPGGAPWRGPARQGLQDAGGRAGGRVQHQVARHAAGGAVGDLLGQAEAEGVRGEGAGQRVGGLVRAGEFLHRTEDHTLMGYLLTVP